MIIRLLRRATVLALALPLAACGGTVTFGDDLTVDASTAAPEAGPAPDATPPDSGVRDLGVDSGADVGPRDVGDSGPVDVGVPCHQRERPPFPATWPYPATKSAYLAKFYTNLPGVEGCAFLGCHAAGIGHTDPLIPATDAELDTPATLQQAIDNLWATAVPSMPMGASSLVTPLLWNHDMAGKATTPFYTPEQATFLQNLIDRSADCAWVPLYQAELASGPPCAGGVCECPVPMSAVAGCL